MDKGTNRPFRSQMEWYRLQAFPDLGFGIFFFFFGGGGGITRLQKALHFLEICARLFRLTQR